MSEKRVALVTGASYGIGQACAARLARDGCDVAVTDLRAETLAATEAKIKAAGGRSLALALDVRSQPGVERAVAAVIESFGRVDVLVNNAGVPLRRAALDMTREEWDGVLSVNLTGAFFMSQQVARHLVGAKRPGCIVNIASTFGVVGIAQRAAYGISKAGVAHMAKMLAVEWAEHGIRVNAVAPGTVETESRAPGLADPGRRKLVTSKIPLGRFGTAEEIAAAVCYLASPGAAFVTGHTLVVDGGTTAD
jgi:NAD(P)-dependent dehydrogenase (short-subunit alcohol dehydrogenase family)